MFASVSSANQPKFCSNASWNPNGITLLQNLGMYATSPLGVFVDTNNTLYVADRANNRIIVWPTGTPSPTRNITANFSSPYDVFVTSTGDLYIDNAYQYGRVEKWAYNATGSIPFLYVNKACYGLFVDRNENLYCSIKNLHQVVKKSSSNDPNTSTIVAGTGCPGMTSYMLSDPNGIFIDDNFNLYVADSSNNRIQRFRPGESNGITVAGYGAQNSITLYSPTDVVLDADGYLFIVDQKNHRVVGSGPYGFRCIIGCTGYSGSAADRLLYPRTLSFDTDGNIYVADTNNNRIQKFFLATNSCGMFSYNNEICISPCILVIDLDETTTLQSTISTTSDLTTMNVGSSLTTGARFLKRPSLFIVPILYRKNNEYAYDFINDHHRSNKHVF